MNKRLSPKLFAALILASLLLAQSLVAGGQSPLEFKHVTVENGLSPGSVLSITQDRKGFLWVGTMDGLNRYDGRNVKVFKSFNRGRK